MASGVLLPAEPIRQIVVDWIEKYGMTQEEFGSYVGLQSRTIYRITSRESYGKMELRVAGNLFFFSRDLPKISWRLADMIVTKTIGPLHWHTDDTLRELYWQADLAREDLVNPLDFPAALEEVDKTVMEVWDSSSSRGEAAKKLGMSLASYSKILDPALRRAGRDLSKKPKAPWRQKTHCKYGHDIATYGRTDTGACRRCKAIYDKERVR